LAKLLCSRLTLSIIQGVSRIGFDFSRIYVLLRDLMLLFASNISSAPSSVTFRVKGPKKAVQNQAICCAHPTNTNLDLKNFFSKFQLKEAIIANLATSLSTKGGDLE